MSTMTVSLLDVIGRPSILGPDRVDEDVPRGEGSTLDDVVSGAWEALIARHTASCPLCGGALAPRYGAGHGPVGGRCRDCGSELS
jgi:hypothetical protein